MYIHTHTHLFISIHVHTHTLTYSITCIYVHVYIACGGEGRRATHILYIFSTHSCNVVLAKRSVLRSVSDSSFKARSTVGASDLARYRGLV